MSSLTVTDLDRLVSKDSLQEITQEIYSSIAFNRDTARVREVIKLFLVLLSVSQGKSQMERLERDVSLTNDADITKFPKSANTHHSQSMYRVHLETVHRFRNRY